MYIYMYVHIYIYMYAILAPHTLRGAGVYPPIRRGALGGLGAIVDLLHRRLKVVVVGWLV